LDHAHVKSVVAGLISADQEDRLALRVECIEDSQGTTTALDSELTKRVSASFKRRSVRVSEGGAPCFEEAYQPSNRLSVGIVKPKEPGLELIGANHLRHMAEDDTNGLVRQGHSLGAQKEVKAM
jgi:hypothetical protein